MARIQKAFVTIMATVSLSIVLQNGKVCAGRVIAVATNGNDALPCLSNSSLPCQTLTFVLQNAQLNDTSIRIQEGTYQVNQTLNVTNVKGLAISGERLGKGTKIMCGRANNTGLRFRDCKAIRLSNFNLESCGFKFETSSMGENGKVVLAFTSLLVINALNVSLENVNITNATGIGSVFYDVVGSVILKFVKFENCRGRIFKMDSRQNISTAGGGIYVELRPNSTKPQLPSKFEFQQCHFVGNDASYMSNNIVSQSKGNEYFSLGRGGAISFIVRGNGQQNEIHIDTCLFRSNKALWGAGIFVELNDGSKNNGFKIVNSVFSDNYAVLSGGGIRIGINSNVYAGNNRIAMEGSRFSRNSAKLGGGFSHYRLVSEGKDEDYVILKNCTFNDNKADIASGMYFHHLNITLNNVNITNKAGGDPKYQQRQLSLYCYSSLILQSGTNYVNGASSTGYLLDYCILTLNGSTTFKGNTGENGGALALYGHSKILLVDGSNLTLHNNIALSKGGAIFVETPVSLQKSFNDTQLNIYKCFFMFCNHEGVRKHAGESSATIDFFGNKALPRGGDNVWATTIQWCRGDEENLYNNSALKWEAIKSNGSRFSTNQTVVTSPLFILVKPEEWNAHPGLQLNATALFRDENWNLVNGTVQARVVNNLTQQDMFFSNYYNDNGLVSLVLNGHQHLNYYIELKTAGRQSVTKVIKGRKLLPCPPGYQFDPKTSSCGCQNIKKGVTYCNWQKREVYIVPNRWGNKDSKSEFALKTCPKHYCRSCTDNGTGCLFLKGKQCAKNRDQESRLCGQCKEGFSVYLGSEICEKVNSNKGIGWLFLFGLFLLFLVIIIMLANVNTYTTSLNALLYSYQVIPMLIHNDSQIDYFLSLMLATINISGSGRLQIGIPIWIGMTDMQKLALNYLCPVCLLVFTAVVAKVLSSMKRFKEKTEFAKRAFVFISVIAYSDFTKLTFKILRPVKIEGQLFSYSAANLLYFGKDHGWYAGFAIFVLIFVVFGFPILILFPNLVTMQGRFVRFIRIFDAFSEPFKREHYIYHMFAAFYFIGRLILLTIFIVMQDGPEKDICFSITCVLILTVFLIFKPYRSLKQNIFDVIQLVNIAIMSIVFTAVSVAYEDGVRRRLNSALWALSYVPLICFISNPLYWLWNRFWHKRHDGGQVDCGNDPVYIPERAFERSGSYRYNYQYHKFEE